MKSVWLVGLNAFLCLISWGHVRLTVSRMRIQIVIIAFDVEITRSWYRLESRLYGIMLVDWMDLGAHIWHPSQILQERMTSWDRDHRTHSLIFDHYYLKIPYEVFGVVILNGSWNSVCEKRFSDTSSQIYLKHEIKAISFTLYAGIQSTERELKSLRLFWFWCD